MLGPDQVAVALQSYGISVDFHYAMEHEAPAGDLGQHRVPDLIRGESFEPDAVALAHYEREHTRALGADFDLAAMGQKIGDLGQQHFVGKGHVHSAVIPLKQTRAASSSGRQCIANDGAPWTAAEIAAWSPSPIARSALKPEHDE